MRVCVRVLVFVCLNTCVCMREYLLVCFQILAHAFSLLVSDTVLANVLLPNSTATIESFAAKLTLALTDATVMM